MKGLFSSERPCGEGGYRHVLRLVIPLVLGNAAFMVMQFTDRILLARYSSDSIQASLPAGMLSFTLVSLFAMIAGYSGTFVSQYHGANDPKGCAKSCVAGLVLSVLFFPVFLALIPLCDWIFSLAGHAPEVLAEERKYAFWMILAGVPFGFHMSLNGYLVGRSHVTASTVATVIEVAVNIGLDVVLIFGYCGCPAMGTEGAALATFLAHFVGIGILLAVIFWDSSVRALPWREIARPDWGLVRRVARFGTPAGVQTFFDAGAFAFFSILVARFDALSCATNNIALSINNLAFAPLMGFGAAASILTGQFMGSRRPALAKTAGWRCLHLGWMYMAAVAIVFLACPEFLIGLFRSPDAAYTTADMIGLGRKLLLFMVLWGMFDTINVVIGGALKGVGDTKFIMWLLIIANWFVWIPAELIVIWKGGDIMDVWIVMTTFFILFSGCTILRWNGGRWMSIQMIDDSSPSAEVRP